MYYLIENDRADRSIWCDDYNQAGMTELVEVLYKLLKTDDIKDKYDEYVKEMKDNDDIPVDINIWTYNEYYIDKYNYVKKHQSRLTSSDVIGMYPFNAKEISDDDYYKKGYAKEFEGYSKEEIIELLGLDEDKANYFEY